MFYKKFIFIKSFNFENQTLPKNTELTVLNDKIYVNGGQITPLYYKLFEGLVNDYIIRGDNTYLKEIIIPYNKI